jgi:hypothetical protein
LCDLGRGTRRSRGDIVRLMKSVRLTEPGSIALATQLLLMPAGVVGATVEQDGQPPAASSSAADKAGSRPRPARSPFRFRSRRDSARHLRGLVRATRFRSADTGRPLRDVSAHWSRVRREPAISVRRDGGLQRSAQRPAADRVRLAIRRRSPVAVATFPHAIIGGGPLLGYRSLGQYQSDAGAVVIFGASIPLRKGLALHVVAPTTALFRRRTTVAVGVAVGVAKVF